MDQLRRPGRLRRLRHPRGAFGLHRVEALLAQRRQDADQVHHHIRAPHRRRDGGVVADIGLHRLHLTHIAIGAQRHRRRSGAARRRGPATRLGRKPAPHTRPIKPDPPTKVTSFISPLLIA